MLRQIQIMLHDLWLFFMVPQRLNEKKQCLFYTCLLPFIVLGSSERKKLGQNRLKNKLSGCALCLSALEFQQSEQRLVLLTGTFANIVPCYESMFLYCLTLTCLYEEKQWEVFWSCPLSHSGEHHLVLKHPREGMLHPGQQNQPHLLCFLLESHRPPSAAWSCSVPVCFTNLLLSWGSHKPPRLVMTDLKWWKK